jgi:mRNA-degrading endonuclease RelE of RelBE toxin-antitoxin system
MSGGYARATTGFVYEIYDRMLVVLVVALGHRRDIYRAR